MGLVGSGLAVVVWAGKWRLGFLLFALEGPTPLFPPTSALNSSASLAPLRQVRAEEELAALQARMEQLR